MAVKHGYLSVCFSEAPVRGLIPDTAGLTNIDRYAVIVTIPGENHDFVPAFSSTAWHVPRALPPVQLVVSLLHTGPTAG
jgi:hypothetical protein|tara:strand:- start:125 stop:361 length:237 start_codon:yes stop_codon:yes gene_type:complete